MSALGETCLRLVRSTLRAHPPAQVIGRLHVKTRGGRPDPSGSTTRRCAAALVGATAVLLTAAAGPAGAAAPPASPGAAPGAAPLVRLAGASPLERTAELTEAGQAVIAGRTRWLTPARWLGGALLDAATPWCWDGEQGRVVQWA